MLIPKKALLWLLVGGSIWLGLWCYRPPSSESRVSPPTNFSAERAQKTLEVMTDSPRPLGSASHDRVRDLLIQELRDLGLEPLVQRAVQANVESANRWDAPVPIATVENVMARIKGTHSTGSVLLMAHYDSVPYSPGAADNGSGVVALLETARAVLAGSPLRNDLILFFPDAEEVGLLGARAFVEDHPWAPDVQLAINLDARGHRGASLLFETSEGNGRLISEAMAGLSHPVGNSLSYEVYKLMPNDTDLTVFKVAGKNALNFAFIEGLTRYHTRLDTLSELSLASLQHHGTNALGLAQHFGDLDLGDLSDGDAVFFNVIGSWVAIYSYPVGRAISLLAIASLLAAVTLSIRRGLIQPKSTVMGLLFSLALLITIPLAAGTLWAMAQAFQPGFRTMTMGDVYSGQYFALGLVAFGVGLFVALWSWLGKKIGFREMWVGGLLILALLLGLIEAAAPGAAYFLAWTLLAASAGLWSQNSSMTWSELVPISSGLAGLLLIAPLVYLLFVSLTLAASALAIFFLVLMLIAAAPLVERLVEGRGKAVLLGVGALGILVVLGGALAADFDDRNPRPNNLFYHLDADAGKATWGSTDVEPDSWTAEYLTSEPKTGAFLDYLGASPEKAPILPSTVLLGEAPLIDLAPPELEFGSRKCALQVEHCVRFRVDSLRHAELIGLHVLSGPKILTASVNGRTISGDPEGRRWSIRYWGVSSEGIEVELGLASPGPLKLRIVEESYELPQSTQSSPRPPSTLPTPFMGFVQDATIISRVYEL